MVCEGCWSSCCCCSLSLSLSIYLSLSLSYPIGSTEEMDHLTLHNYNFPVQPTLEDSTATKTYARDANLSTTEKQSSAIYSLDDFGGSGMDWGKAWLKVEYQCVRGLDPSQTAKGPPNVASATTSTVQNPFVLFTIHTYSATLREVVQRAPKAAIMLARALRGLPPILRKYRGVEGKVEEIAGWLERECKP